MTADSESFSDTQRDGVASGAMNVDGDDAIELCARDGASARSFGGACASSKAAQMVATARSQAAACAVRVNDLRTIRHLEAHRCA